MPNAWGDAFGTDTSTGPCNLVTGVCGTGGWTGPKPGDPDNNSILSATPAYGGIDVSWGYPTTNPHALAHTLIYRGVSSNFALALPRTTAAGSFFYDRIPKEDIKEYFYWIQFVSINGTVGEVIGPASAVPMSSIAETIEDLTGLIDSGVLAQSLKTKIDEIDLLRGDLTAETLARFTNNDELAYALAAVQLESGEAKTYILDEVQRRASSEDALISQMNAISAGMNGNLASIIAEQTVQATNTTALVTDVSLLLGRVDDNAAALLTESNVRVAADTALANQITTAQSALGTDIASAQTTLQTNINTVDDKVTSIGALYTAKVDVNGLIGGFGIYNDGTTVEAGFDVDKFWIGRTTNKTKPFIIDNGVVYINEAAIQSLTADKIRAGSIGVQEYIGSQDYIAGQSGWRISGSGNAEFNNGYFNGNISASSVEAALGSASYWAYDIPGTYSLTIPAGLSADKLRIRLSGASGSGGGGGGGAYHYTIVTTHIGAGGNGGDGGTSATVTGDFAYNPAVGLTLSITVGTGYPGGSGGAGRYQQGYVTADAGAGGSNGQASTVVGYISSAGGIAGSGGGGGTTSVGGGGDTPGATGANGGNGAGGANGIGGLQAGNSNVQGTVGTAGTGGRVEITVFKGDVLVKNTSYQNLLAHLLTKGLGPIPENAY